MKRTENRKDDHVRIALDKNVSAFHNYWEDVKLIHNALPEINKEDIDLSTKIFGKVFRSFCCKIPLWFCDLYFVRFKLQVTTTYINQKEFIRGNQNGTSNSKRNKRYHARRKNNKAKDSWYS